MLFEFDLQVVSVVLDLFFEVQFCVWCELVLCQCLELELIICLVDEVEGLELNSIYWYKDYVINVLFFFVDVLDEFFDILLFGDLVICVLVVVCEVLEQCKLLQVYWVYLVIYGCLYLFGYDYIDDVEVEEMEILECELLVELGYFDLYVCDDEELLSKEK